MCNHKNPFFTLLLLSLIFTSCKGQITSVQTTNKTNPPKHPNIVRTMGTYGENVNCELLDKAGNLWFSINGEGAYCYNGISFTNFTMRDGLCNNNVGPIIQDKAGNILFGTDKGICKYDGKKFTSIAMTDSLHIISLFEDRDGILWFGVMNKGIYRYDGTNLTNFLYKYKHSYYGDKIEKFISDILQDKNGNIWFSSWNGGGVWRYDGKSIEQFLPSMDYYTSNQDKRRTSNATTSLDLLSENKAFIQSSDHISDDMIFSMTEDNLGNIWFATRNHGACLFNPVASLRTGSKTFTSFGAKQGFLSDGAYTILQDRKGNLWFTTDEDGVWCYDGKTIKNFNEKDGLIYNAVMNVIEDKEGNLWFGTKWTGLSRYDGKTFTTFSQNDN